MIELKEAVEKVSKEMPNYRISKVLDGGDFYAFFVDHRRWNGDPENRLVTGPIDFYAVYKDSGKIVPTIDSDVGFTYDSKELDIRKFLSEEDNEFNRKVKKAMKQYEEDYLKDAIEI